MQARGDQDEILQPIANRLYNPRLPTKPIHNRRQIGNLPH